MHLQNFIKIHQLVHKILSIKKFQHQSRAITLLKINKKYYSIIQIYILSISMHIQNLIEIHKLIYKILSINKILTSIKGHNSVNKALATKISPPLRSFLVCILNFDKTSKIFSKCNHLFGRHLGETHFVHKSRAITQLKNKEKQNVIG